MPTPIGSAWQDVWQDVWADVWAGAGGGGSSPEIAVSGNGNNITDGDATPSLTDHTDFGSITQGGATVSRTFTVSNPGTATLTISGVTVPTGYTVTTALPGTIAAGGNAPLIIRLDNATIGTKSGELVISSDDADEATFNVALTGAVTAVSGPEIGVTGAGLAIGDGDSTPSAPDGTDFGAVILAGATASRTFVVANPGTSTLTVSSVTVPTGFTVTTALPGTIAAGGNANLIVRLDAAAAGSKSGSVTINSDALSAAAFDFAVRGDVIDPSGGGGGSGSFQTVRGTMGGTGRR